MTSATQSEAVRLDVTVDVPVEHAFRVFTEQFGEIKPREHNLLGAEEVVETVVETRVGGHIYDRGESGTVCRWARVLVFEPPRRFVISWDISPTWQLETDPSRASEVEVSFVAETSDRTRVELEHRHLERHGEGWESVRDGVADPGGWPLYLQRYVEAIG
ncbi:SRPBCC family protein [Nocardioides sp.]|uniref:SRPBCC family protein n=1 Tax=Nocardioides sp. TaxID=35761 RepID=UPI002732C153|nr:SRPBCC family protein [Nocardioides sp.]MDP3894284.1 SRPBCC family protein [Nocardioides sp.]